MRVSPLLGDIDMIVTVWTFVDRRRKGPRVFREATVWLGRPLHRRPRAVTLRQVEIVAHPDLVAIADHRRSRQRKHQAVGEFETATIASQHRRQATPDAAIVE